MSKKRIRGCCLVVDASVAHAAGAQHPTSRLCRDFLISIQGVCHRIAWSQAIKAEWDKHQSPFAAQWLVSMMRISKLRAVKDQGLAELREAIDEHSSDPNVAPVMLKDVHLIEAALATDCRIASLDDTARGHFARLGKMVAALRGIVWVNQDRAKSIAAMRLLVIPPLLNEMSNGSADWAPVRAPHLVWPTGQRIKDLRFFSRNNPLARWPTASPTPHPYPSPTWGEGVG